MTPGDELGLGVVIGWLWKFVVSLGAVVGFLARRELKQIEEDRKKLNEIAEGYVDREKFDDALTTVHAKIEAGHKEIREEIHRSVGETNALLRQVLGAMLPNNKWQ